MTIQKPTILIAEDDIDIRGIIAGAISALGFNVIEAGDGAQAICLINEIEIDLAILDYMMPEKNGKLSYITADNIFKNMFSNFNDLQTLNILMHSKSWKFNRLKPICVEFMHFDN